MTEQRCNSTKEELRADGYKNADDCPVCLRHENFQWAVGDHRSAAEAVQPGNYLHPVNSIELFPSHILHICILFAFDEFYLMR